jgi:hypothetical protein
MDGMALCPYCSRVRLRIRQEIEQAAAEAVPICDRCSQPVSGEEPDALINAVWVCGKCLGSDWDRLMAKEREIAEAEQLVNLNEYADWDF